MTRTTKRKSAGPKETKETKTRRRTRVQEDVAAVRVGRERALLTLIAAGDDGPCPTRKIAPIVGGLARRPSEAETRVAVAGRAGLSVDRGSDGRGPITCTDNGLLRGDLEPEVVVGPDGRVTLAALEWSTELGDGGEQ